MKKEKSNKDIVRELYNKDNDISLEEIKKKVDIGDATIKTYIHQIKKENIRTNEIIMLTFKVILSFILLGFIAYLSIDIFWKPLEYTFAQNTLDRMILNILVIVMIGALLYIILDPILQFIQLKKNIAPLRNTIILMVVVFLIGYLNLFAVLGNNPLELYLRDSNNNSQIVGDIKCKGESIDLLVGEDITCEIKPNLKNLTGVVYFYRIDRNDLRIQIDDTIEFNASGNVKRILFSLNGIDENNKYREVEIANDFRFYTADETAERKKDLVKYLFGLLALVFISIPPMVLSLMKINDYNSSKKN